MEQQTDKPGKGELLARRIGAVLLHPSTAWPEIAEEATTLRQLITEVAMPLAAIGPVARLIHGMLFGTGTMMMGTMRFGLGGGLAGALGDFIKQLLFLAIAGLLIETLASRFGGKGGRIEAFKLATWSLSAGWVAGAFELLPGLGVAGLLASLYGIFLLNLGAGPVLKMPEEQTGSFTVAVVAAVIALWLVLQFALIPMGGPMMGMMR